MVFSFWLAREAPGDPFLIQYQSQEKHFGLSAKAVESSSKQPLFFFSFEPLDEGHLVFQFFPSISFNGTHNQFFSWTKKLFTGDLGNSFRWKSSIWKVIFPPFLVSIMLGTISTLIMVLLAIWLALVLSESKSSKTTNGIWLVLDFLYSIPPYWLAILLLIFFTSSSFLQIFPSGGLGGEKSNVILSFLDMAYHLFLPIICLSLPPVAYFTKIIHQNIGLESKKVYSLNSASRGFSARWILRKEVLRNSLIPLFAHIPLFLSSILGGALMIEKIFNLPGMGKLMVDAFSYRDYPIIFSIALLTGLLTLTAFLVTDLLYVRFSPQIGRGFNKS